MNEPYVTATTSWRIKSETKREKWKRQAGIAWFWYLVSCMAIGWAAIVTNSMQWPRLEIFSTLYLTRAMYLQHKKIYPRRAKLFQAYWDEPVPMIHLRWLLRNSYFWVTGSPSAKIFPVWHLVLTDQDVQP